MAILERSKNRVESGVVVESDSLSAQVRLATRKQELIRAQNNLAMARVQLSVAMGLSTQSDFEPSDALAERNLPATPLEELEKQAIESRPDLKRIRFRGIGAAGKRLDREIVIRAASKCLRGLGGR